jgi:hypothetical protein
MASNSNNSSSVTVSPTPIYAPCLPNIHWIGNKGRYHAFEPKSPDANDDDDIQNILEFEAIGIFPRVFLQAYVKSHTVIVIIGRTEIDRIKSVIFSVSNFQERGYRYPFDGFDVEFTPKENLDDVYENIWDARDIDVHNINSRLPLTIDGFEKGCKVFICRIT